MTDTAPQTPFLADAAPQTPFLADAVTAELEDWGPLEEATGEPMQASGRTLWQDGEQETGVWECTPGPSYWKLETNEFVHILTGRVTVTPDGGAPLACRCGRLYCCIRLVRLVDDAARPLVATVVVVHGPGW